MRRLGQQVAFAVVSLSLMVSSTAAVASAPAPTPAPFQATGFDGWMTLSMLTPSTVASTGVLAAQPETPPPPPPPPPGYTGPATPPLPVILIWLAVLGVDIYILTKNNHEHPLPNSPA